MSAPASPHPTPSVEPGRRRRSLVCRMGRAKGLCWIGMAGAYAFYECGGCGFVFAPDVHRSQVEADYRTGQSSVTNGAPK